MKWEIVIQELSSVYMNCPGLQAGITCGDGNQAWYFPIQDSPNSTDRFIWERLSRTSQWFGEYCGLFWDGPSSQRAACSLSTEFAWKYNDNNAHEILTHPDSEYSMWDCCSVQLVSYGKQEDDDDMLTEKSMALIQYDT